jgi:mono/diheme cytochrome c family protein
MRIVCAAVGSLLAAGALLTSLVASAGGPTGKQSFETNCSICHQSNAAGAEGLAPSLVGTLEVYLQSTQGREYLSQILISGMAGTIVTQGHDFKGLMPSFADTLSDSDAAATLNYVLAIFNDQTTASPTSPITALAVASARARKPTATDTRRLRATILGGGL